MAVNKKERKGSWIKQGTKVPILTAAEAAALIRDGDTVCFGGTGGGIAEPTELIEALARRYRETESPKNLVFYHTTGLGDRRERGMSPLAQAGLVKRVIGAHWDQSPRLAQMAAREEIEAYNFPMGIMSQLYRTAAAGQPGLFSKTGLGTFIDPRQQGGRLNERTTEELVELKEVEGEEYLFYRTVFPDVALIRGTTADTEGYLSMEDEVAYIDNLAQAMAVHNNGGLVIAQVQRVVKNRSLHPKRIQVPGYLIDALVVAPDQPQLYDAPVNRFMSGDYVLEEGGGNEAPLNERKVIARRALMEAKPGDVGNIGVGIADGIGVIAREEGVEQEFTLTVETGPIGGVSAQGIFFGASVNLHALLDMPAMFDFYDGGGLDVCFLSFAEVDAQGNVNVHKFGGKIIGIGGFVNISQNTKKVVFCGTLKAKGLRVNIEDHSVKIEQEGGISKFVERVPEITFNGRDAFRRGQEVLFLTERAVFCQGERGLILTEIAPGVDLQKDVLDQMDFCPEISPDLKRMDPRLFQAGQMGIKEEFCNRR